ncbi:hypothetical protein MO973_39685 [Paenibacillus sp. TRM 82003]|nr:hypothetical protein [Paenibacillus sp. TRM 82003]
MQIILLAVMVTHEHVLNSKDFYALTVACVGIILLTILLRIPLLYSSLIWGTGYLLVGVIQIILIFGFTIFGGISMSELQSSPTLNNIAMFSTFIIVLGIVFLIDKKRLGFMFITNRFRLQKRGIKLKDYFIAIFFICTITLLQMALTSFFTNQLNHYLFIVLGSMIVISLIGLYVTYLFNVREIEERFSSFRGKKH